MHPNKIYDVVKSKDGVNRTTESGIPVLAPLNPPAWDHVVRILFVMLSHSFFLLFSSLN